MPIFYRPKVSWFISFLSLRLYTLLISSGDFRRALQEQASHEKEELWGDFRRTPHFERKCYFWRGAAGGTLADVASRRGFGRRMLGWINEGNELRDVAVIFVSGLEIEWSLFLEGDSETPFFFTPEVVGNYTFFLAIGLGTPQSAFKSLLEYIS